MVERLPKRVFGPVGHTPASLSMPEDPSPAPRFVTWFTQHRPLLTISAALVWARIWSQSRPFPLTQHTVVVLALVAWVASVMARWEEDTLPSLRSPFEPIDLILTLLAISYLALAKLPSGMMVLGLPLGAMAVAQGLLSAGPYRPWAARLAFLLAIVLGAFVTTGGFLNGTFGWMPFLLLGLMFAAAAGSWNTPHRMRLPPPLRILMRGLIFAGGVILPTVWAATSSLKEHFFNRESALTILTGVLGMWAIYHLRREGRVSEKIRRWPLVLACGALAALSALALLFANDAPLPLIPQASGLWALGLWLGFYLPWSTRGSLLPVWCAVATVAALLLRST